MRHLSTLGESPLQKMARMSKPPGSRRRPLVTVANKRPEIKSFGTLPLARVGFTAAPSPATSVPTKFVRSAVNVRFCKSMGDFQLFSKIQQACQRLGTILPHTPLTHQRDNTRNIFFLKSAADLEVLVREPQAELTETCFDILRTMIEFHVFRERSPIPKQFYMGDAKATIYLTHLDELQHLHTIWVLIIERAKHDHLTNWFTPAFIRKFIHLFSSPDPREQISLRKTLSKILEVVPETRDSVILEAIAQLERVSSNVDPVFSAEGVLQTLTSLCARESESIVDRVIDVACRLFTHDLLQYFYDSLHGLIAAITKTHPKKAPQVLAYVLRHWPYTSAGKQTYFLHHASWQIRMFAIQEEALIRRFEVLFLESLNSWNFRVLVVAITQAGERALIDVLEQHQRGIYLSIFNAISQHREHWSREVVDAAELAHAKMLAGYPELAQTPVDYIDGKLSKDTEAEAKRAAAWAAIQSLQCV